jgi:hypothetical protein
VIFSLLLTQNIKLIYPNIASGHTKPEQEFSLDLKINTSVKLSGSKSLLSDSASSKA